MIGTVTAPIIFGKMHFLLISGNEFIHEIKCNGMTIFIEFMIFVRKTANNVVMPQSLIVLTAGCPPAQ